MNDSARARSVGGISFVAVVIVCALACAIACNGTASTDELSSRTGGNCSVPDADIYFCDGAVTGEGACGSAPYDEELEAGTDASFPVGCIVRLPVRSGFLEGSATCHPAQECECGIYRDSGPGWLCGV